jgi:putative Holliday junction resolvase
MRYLALDVGDERIGLALSDETGQLARPLTIIRRVSGPTSFHHIAQLVQEHGIDQIVVGLPLLPDGSSGTQVASARAYVAGLARHVTTPIVYWDERYSSETADQIIAGNRKRARRPAHNDDVAAAVILQGYLDRERTAHGAAMGDSAA